ncbi:MAG: hypothetical protein K6U74_17785 [Firmicutes bacterium]|nr:hypothetical protein [Bacillota bacterium]
MLAVLDHAPWLSLVLEHGFSFSASWKTHKSKVFSHAKKVDTIKIKSVFKGIYNGEIAKNYQGRCNKYTSSTSKQPFLCPNTFWNLTDHVVPMMVTVFSITCRFQLPILAVISTTGLTGILAANQRQDII